MLTITKQIYYNIDSPVLKFMYQSNYVIISIVVEDCTCFCKVYKFRFVALIIPLVTDVVITDHHFSLASAYHHRDGDTAY